MRKAISLVLAAIMVLSSVVPAAAQKRLSGNGLTNRSETKEQAESTRFANLTAYTDGNGVWLSWQMEAEVGNIGFYPYRVSNGSTELLNTTKGIIPGAATHVREFPSYGQSYSYYDAGGTADSAYFIESLSLTGAKSTSTQVYPQYIPDLKAVTGLEREELAHRAESEPTSLEHSGLPLTKEIAADMAQYSLTPDPVTHRTVISQAGAVRIGVKNEGLHRVTRSQLQAAGFDVNQDPNNWQLFVEGIEQAIIIGPNADYIEFYGKNTDTNETDIRKYFLINGATAGKRVGTRVARPNTSTVVTPSYAQTYVKRERFGWVDDIVNGDLDNYFGRGFNSTLSTLNFTISGIDTAVPTATLRLKIQGYSPTTHAVEVTLNDQLLGTQGGGFADQPFTIAFTVPTSLLHEGANNIKYRAVGVPNDFCFFDTLSIDFNRRYLADQNKLNFYTQNYRIAQLSGFSSANVRVFDMTNQNEPILMTNLTFVPTGPTFGVDMPPARSRLFYAIEDSAFFVPESVTPNNPELISNPANGADLVIIAYKDLLPQAQTWANYRIAQGTSVKLIEVSEIFDEYNYGTFGSVAIRSFLQDAQQNWSNAPEYVLLIGDGSWDSRNYEGLGNFNFVPSRIVSTIFSDTASDEWLADFNSDGLADMAIGRISARTAAQLTTAYNKMVLWESLPLDQWHTRGAVFAFDHNNGYPFSQMSTNLRNQLPMIADANVRMVYRGEPNANANILAALGTGPYIANYAGHGTAGSWGGIPTFFNALSVPNVPESNPSIYTMLTCLNGYFHWLYNPSMAETLLYTPNKGAVVAWASTGLTTPDVQELMATRFYQKIGEGTIPRLGDLVKDAKTVVPGGSDVRLSWVLLGDPMMKVRAATPPPGPVRLAAEAPMTKNQ